MKDRVPATLDGLVSAARRDVPSLSRLSRLADEVAARSPSAYGSSLRSSVRPRAAIAVVAASAVAFGVFATSQLFDAPRPTVVASSGSEPPSRVESTAATPREAEPAATDPASQAPEIPTIDVRSLPDPKLSPGGRRGSSDSAKAAPGEEMTEGELLHRAHAALSSNPAQALALTAEHGRRFPSGMLVQEREVIAIEALARLARTAEARRRAETFFANYTSSAYRRRVDDALASLARTPSFEETR
ncbi:MAG: hypothetical protein BGO98_04360 [Myxococcales bacterium 68-20]|nr:hypothetical protein [Myxococcales bacterium]OJY20530.1 MAG: hypothetical protein BGO98_04360 [Myxococcales bacterium 68-20]